MIIFRHKYKGGSPITFYQTHQSISSASLKLHASRLALFLVVEVGPSATQLSVRLISVVSHVD